MYLKPRYRYWKKYFKNMHTDIIDRKQKNIIMICFRDIFNCTKYNIGWFLYWHNITPIGTWLLLLLDVPSVPITYSHVYVFFYKNTSFYNLVSRPIDRNHFCLTSGSKFLSMNKLELCDTPHLVHPEILWRQ